MQKKIFLLILPCVAVLLFGCTAQNKITGKSAAEILGNPGYPAFSYGGYRDKTRETPPAVADIKEDLRILSALGIRVLRTYNSYQFPQTARLLQAIREMKDSVKGFEMYVMVGTWIECEGAWTGKANHNAGNEANNSAEIQAAVSLAKKYPDIVKMIAVGNEAMVQWAINYFVYPNTILKWVQHLQDLKKSGELPADLWITSSDNFESWGGRATNYHTKDLEALIKAVDFISMHTYSFHDTYYNPGFWGVPPAEEGLSEKAKVDAAMQRALDYGKAQYQGTADYVKSIGVNKPIHIGETGWASIASSTYGATGSHAADEYKGKKFYELMRAWTTKNNISCFYFEAFDEKWKDQGNELGSENHFGLITLDGQAKYTLWQQVDDGVFKGLTRNGKPITKTYNGNEQQLMDALLPVPTAKEIGILEIKTVNDKRKPGEPVTEANYVITAPGMEPNSNNNSTYPVAPLKLNAWEGTCGIKMGFDGVIDVTTGTGNSWWGCALELQSGETGEDMSNFLQGKLHFEISGTTNSAFRIGFQTGVFANGDQVNNYVVFAPGGKYSITKNWTSYTIPVADLKPGKYMGSVMAPLYFAGDARFDGGHVYLKNVYYSR